MNTGTVLAIFILALQSIPTQDSAGLDDFLSLNKKIQFIVSGKLNYNPELEQIGNLILKELNRCGAKDLSGALLGEFIKRVKHKTGFFGYELYGFTGSTIDLLAERTAGVLHGFPLKSNLKEAALAHAGGRYLLLIGKQKLTLPHIDVDELISTGKDLFLWGKLHDDYKTPELFVQQPDGKISTLSPAVNDGMFHIDLPGTGLKGSRLEILADGAFGKEVLEIIEFSDSGDLCELIAAATDEADKEQPLGFKTPEAYLFELINAERKQAGLPSLSYDKELAKVARGHSYQMAVKGIFGHRLNPGKSLLKRLKSNGIIFMKGFENIAISPSLLNAHKYLCQTPSHYQIILNPKIKKIGIGVVMSSGYYFITEDFVY